MQMRRCPLLIVDVQNGFVNDRSRHVIAVIQRLADRWLDLEWPIYLSQFTNHPGSQWERLLDWSRLIDDDEIALTTGLDYLRPHATAYRKQTYSCVVEPFLGDTEASEWTDVVICGIATDSCVLATAVDLFEFSERDIRPIVVSDACASHAGDQAHESGLFLIKRFIGARQVVSSSELLKGRDIGSDSQVTDAVVT